MRHEVAEINEELTNTLQELKDMKAALKNVVVAFRALNDSEAPADTDEDFDNEHDIYELGCILRRIERRKGVKYTRELLGTYPLPF